MISQHQESVLGVVPLQMKLIQSNPFHGASVQVKGTLRIGQKTNFTPPTLDSLINVLDTPEPIRFPTEVATDIIQVEINGQQRYMYAMRGIPIVFVTAFKNIALDLDIIPIAAGNPIYTIQETSGGQEIQSTPNLSGAITSPLRYNSPTFRERFVKVYFPPNNIRRINAPNLNIRTSSCKISCFRNITNSK